MKIDYFAVTSRCPIIKGTRREILLITQDGFALKVLLNNKVNFEMRLSKNNFRKIGLSEGCVMNRKTAQPLTL